MAGPSNANREMEESFARFSIEDEEQEELSYVEESEVECEIDTRWCLVGKFLTDSSIDFQAMQHKMASLWRPGKGMYVKQLEPNRFLFQFYHELDIKRVSEGSPWTFGRFHLVFERLKEGMDPRTMAINNLEIWVQLHGIGTAFMSQRVVTDIGNHIGNFVEADANNFVGVWRDHFRVRVSIPLDVPLKRRMKLRKSATEWCWVTFKYEAIPTFCFICGLIGHSDKFCSKLFDSQGELIEKPYGSWMRADPKRRSYTMGSKWLRPGGAIPVNKSGEEEADKSNAVKVAPANRDNAESGIGVENRSQIIVLTDSVNQGVRDGIHGKSHQLAIFPREKSAESLKRRRTAQDEKSPEVNMISSPHVEEMEGVTNTEQNQKNLLLAGTALQSRQSL